MAPERKIRLTKKQGQRPIDVSPSDIISWVPTYDGLGTDVELRPGAFNGGLGGAGKVTVEESPPVISHLIRDAG
jgi:hypothetical protein